MRTTQRLPLPLLLLLAAACWLPGAAAAEGPTFLETPTYTIAGVLLFFLILSTLFERATHLLIWYLKKIHRNGLAAAASNLVMELTLIGFISLILIVAENKIHSICVPYEGSSYTNWLLLHNVDGCNCCLADTSGVSYCFQQARDCGADPPFCNCDAKDQCAASEALRRLLAPAEYPGTAPICDGKSALQWETDVCPQGKAPIVSLNALHQIHLFIFIVAVSHVAMGIVMIILADLRFLIWRRWAEEEDEHVAEVRRVLDCQQASLGPQPPPSRMSKLRMFVRGGGGALTRSRKRTPLAEAKGASSARALVEPEEPPAPSWWGSLWLSISDPLMRRFRRTGHDSGRSALAAAAEAAAAEAAGGAGTTEPLGNGKLAEGDTAEDSALGAGQGLSTIEEGSAHSSSAALQRRGTSMNGRLCEGEQSSIGSTSGGSSLLSNGNGGGRSMQSLEVEGPGAAAMEEDGASGEGDESEPPSFSHVVVAVPSESAHLPPAPLKTESVQTKSGNSTRRMLARTGTIKTKRGWWKEWGICLLIQLLPAPLSKEDFKIMRASFMLTHRVPRSFDFLAYITASMEDDFAQIVGVSLEMWTCLVLFICFSGLIGWPVVLFLGVSAALQVLVDAKIVQIMRHVTRGGRVNKLASNIFWFRRPPLLLIPIKFVLFFCSFVVGTTIFFATTFGPHSCPLSNNTGFWFAWMPHWWWSLVFSLYIFAHLAFKTLPLYSLTVQMGSDFKHNMIPKGVRDKLLRIAQHVKAKRRAREAEEREATAAEGSLMDQGLAKSKAVGKKLVTAGKYIVKPPPHH